MRYPNAAEVERVLESIHGLRTVRGLADETGLSREKVHSALRILRYKGAVVQVRSRQGSDRWGLRRSIQ